MRNTLPFVVRADEIARLETENENLRQQIDRQMSENIRRREWERRHPVTENWTEALLRHQERLQREPDEGSQEELVAVQVALARWARSESQIAELANTLRQGTLRVLAAKAKEIAPGSDLVEALERGEPGLLNM